MITKDQWLELCSKIAEKRKEGKEVYLQRKTIQDKIQCCYYQEGLIILDNNEHITHDNFIGKSCRTVKHQFLWKEIRPDVRIPYWSGCE